MKKTNKILTEMLYQRMLNLAEFEQNKVFRKIYIDILRKLELK